MEFYISDTLSTNENYSNRFYGPAGKIRAGTGGGPIVYERGQNKVRGDFFKKKKKKKINEGGGQAEWFSCVLVLTLVIIYCLYCNKYKF